MRVLGEFVVTLTSYPVAKSIISQSMILPISTLNLLILLSQMQK